MLLPLVGLLRVGGPWTSTQPQSEFFGKASFVLYFAVARSLTAHYGSLVVILQASCNDATPLLRTTVARKGQMGLVGRERNERTSENERTRDQSALPPSLSVTFFAMSLR